MTTMKAQANMMDGFLALLDNTNTRSAEYQDIGELPNNPELDALKSEIEFVDAHIRSDRELETGEHDNYPLDNA